MFRKLKASEIDCRVSTIIHNKGLSLLLYKDARVDMSILDETVGPMNWQRRHSRENANCTILIWDREKGQWIGKEDTGTESNTEAEKGLASDSFKRAGVCWGIGRELYTAPFIWIYPNQCTIKVNDKTGKPYCKDRFRVTRIDYEGDVISSLEIVNESTGAVVFEHPMIKTETNVTDDIRETALKALLKEHGILQKTIYELYKVKSLKDLSDAAHANIATNIEKIKEMQDGKQSENA